jgi:hypothetical protein
VRLDGRHRRGVVGSGACIGTPQSSAGPLVLDGTRAAWLRTDGGTTLGGEVHVLVPARGGRDRVVQRTSETDVGGGSHLSGLAAGAGLIAWAVTSDVRVSDPGCDFGCVVGVRTTVRRLVGARARPVTTIENEAQLLAAAGRRLVVRVGGELQILAPDGTLVASVIAPDTVAAAIRRDRVLLLRRDRIDWLAPDGTVADVLPITGRGRPGASLAVRGRYVVYTDTGRVHVVLLEDGVDRVLVRVRAGPVRGSGLVGIGIGNGGVAYGRNRGCRAPGDCRGEMHVISNAAIARALRHG